MHTLIYLFETKVEHPIISALIALPIGMTVIPFIF